MTTAQTIAQLCRDYTGRVLVTRVTLDKQGYSSDGVYFGIGQPMYFMEDQAELWAQHFRAADINEAVEIARTRFPNARIRVI